MKAAMRLACILAGLILGSGCDRQPSAIATTTFSPDDASRYAQLALDCIPQEYPNKLQQLLIDATDLKPPRQLHPAFYGCYDWHSAVHGHWMLVKVLKTFADLPDEDRIRAQLAASIDSPNIAAEVAYLERESKSWERMYGWGWLLQLRTELLTWDDPLAERLAADLEPLADLLRQRFFEFLPVQVYPVRTGVHPNTAFAMSFAWDYAQQTQDEAYLELLAETARRYYGMDQDCPISWEPSGEDFLSPCLEEAALMSRVMAPAEFVPWLDAFLPQDSALENLEPVDASDRSDPKIAHLDGLNLSRAWNLRVIANVLPDADRAGRLRVVADAHLDASLPYVTGEHYVGSHWLGSFAIYALTRAAP